MSDNNEKQKKKLMRLVSGIALAISLIILMVVFNQKSNKQSNNINFNVSVYNSNNEVVFEKTIDTDDSNLLKALKNEQDLKIRTQSSNFGEFVISIYDIDQDDSHFWNYYINGNYADNGAGSYELKSNDKIEWHLEKFSEEF